MKNENRIAKGINFLTPIYQLISRFIFANQIFKSQIYYLSELKNASSVLIVGGGNGDLLLELLKQKTATNYYYLDLSDKMISYTKKRVEKMYPKQLNTITFHCGSEKNLPENIFFDVIITPFVLDFFSGTDLKKMMQQLDEKLAPKGKWLMIDFNIPAKPKWMTFFSKIIIRFLYFFFNIFCALGVRELPCFEKYFFDLGYQSHAKKYFLNGLLISQIYMRE
ncbi:MAG TPA: class I SAM-dependent methyltransferase [Bacteroidia bacterium]|nr:class I SAM-dependent methyltransferase [Bacteroidia bacterium]